ncbi:hypothetical protein VCR6J2_230081 [Vibrio coralliirubri]|nr:hypothetical protein VCR6J2_230081 [Vibrio coralliirubri]
MIIDKFLICSPQGMMDLSELGLDS